MNFFRKSLRGGGQATRRCWEFVSDDGYHCIELVTYTLSGRRVAFIDGDEIYNQILLPFRNPDNSIPFTTGSNKFGEIKITISNLGGVVHTCLYDGAELEDPLAGKGENLTLERFKVGIGDTRIEDGTVYFQVRKDDGREVKSSEKRYQDFAHLHANIVAWYRGPGAKFLSSVPNLPSKQMRMWTDHTSEKFMEDRKSKLEIYLRQLIHVPRIARNPDIKRFLKVPLEFGFEGGNSRGGGGGTSSSSWAPISTASSSSSASKSDLPTTYSIGADSGVSMGGGGGGGAGGGFIDLPDDFDDGNASIL